MSLLVVTLLKLKLKPATFSDACESYYFSAIEAETSKKVTVNWYTKTSKPEHLRKARHHYTCRHHFYTDKSQRFIGILYLQPFQFTSLNGIVHSL